MWAELTHDEKQAMHQAELFMGWTDYENNAGGTLVTVDGWRSTTEVLMRTINRLQKECERLEKLHS